MIPFLRRVLASEQDLLQQVLVVGRPGSAKTSFMTSLVKAAMAVWGWAAVFCTSKSDPAVYSLVRTLGGQRLTLTPGKETCTIDPLAALAGLNDTYQMSSLLAQLFGSNISEEYGQKFFAGCDIEAIHEGFDFARRLGKPVRSLLDLERAVLDAQAQRKTRRDPTGVELTLRQLAHQPIFLEHAGVSTWKPALGGLTYLSTEAVPLLVQAATTRILLQLVFGHHKATRGCRTLFVVDEAQSVFSSGAAAFQPLAQGRSYGLSVVVGIQSLELLRQRRGADTGRYLWENSGSKIITSVEDARALKDLLALSGEKITFDRSASVTRGFAVTFTASRGPRLTTTIEPNECLDWLAGGLNRCLLVRSGKLSLDEILWPFSKEEYDRLQTEEVWPDGPTLTLPPAPVSPAPTGGSPKKPGKTPLTPKQRKEDARKRFENKGKGKRKNP